MEQKLLTMKSGWSMVQGRTAGKTGLSKGLKK